MELKYWFLELFLIYKVMLNFSIYSILLTAIAFYIWLDDNTLLSLHCFICILLDTKSALMVSFSCLMHNVYPVFLVKLIVMAKKVWFNIKQIGISSGFTYTKYKSPGVMFNFAILDLWQKIIKIIIESYKQFCSIYVQLLRFQSPKKSIISRAYLTRQN